MEVIVPPKHRAVSELNGIATQEMVLLIMTIITSLDEKYKCVTIFKWY
jgi:hypothetical protein